MTRVALYAGPVVRDLEPLSIVLKSLGRAGIDCVVYDAVEVEPTDRSFKAGAAFAADGGFDGFVSVGGGSVMDTCKAGFSNPANGILTREPDNNFPEKLSINFHRTVNSDSSSPPLVPPTIPGIILGPFPWR